MKKQVSLKLSKQRFHFSAAHFTIFSNSLRERIHGHNYYLEVEVFYNYPDDFIDYNYAKNAIEDACSSLDEYLLIPEMNKNLKISIKNANYEIKFNNETISIPMSDVLILPTDNITIEALSIYISEKIRHKLPNFNRIIVSLSSGPGQSATCEV